MARQVPGLALRIALTAILLACLFIAWGSGVDRLSARAPLLERLVPAGLRAQAERSAAAIALSREDGPSALAHSAAAVRADPLDPVSNALLGASRRLAGDEAGAEAAFRVAAQRGWREPITQFYWYDAALRRGDMNLAVLRADAILRVNLRFPDADEMLFAPLEQSEGGRSALARRLAEGPPWLGRYFAFAGIADDVVLRRRVQVAVATAEQGARLGCETARVPVFSLLRRGMRRDAELLWQAHCDPGLPTGGLADGGFEQLADANSDLPFGWRRHSSGDLLIATAEMPSGGNAARLRNSSSVSKAPLTQAVGLAEGSYLLRADVRIAGRPAQGRVVASLDCGGQPRRPARVSGDMAGGGQRLVALACESQTLGLWLRPGDGEVTIDELRLEPLD